MDSTQRKVDNGGLYLWLSDSEKFGQKEPSGHFLTSVSITMAVDMWESFLLQLKLTVIEVLYVVNVTCQRLLKSLWVNSDVLVLLQGTCVQALYRYFKLREQGYSHSSFSKRIIYLLKVGGALTEFVMSYFFSWIVGMLCMLKLFPPKYLFCVSKVFYN